MAEVSVWILVLVTATSEGMISKDVDVFSWRPRCMMAGSGRTTFIKDKQGYVCIEMKRKEYYESWKNMGNN
ncbi:MAG: hypothetical protein CMO44_12200 [Verrucomicrobiales bacterium]|nr:hypothetical protein [Verrucomicrobiales bacterium]